MTALKASNEIISPLLPHRLTCKDLKAPPRLKHRSLELLPPMTSPFHERRWRLN